MKSTDLPATTSRRPITRPPVHRQGDAAPWAVLPPEQRRPIPLERVRAALADDRSVNPGPAVELWRTVSGVRPPHRPAAVLVPLFEEEGEARVILTVRSDRLRSHQGEVAFPGGRLDGAESVIEGALREAEEEVSIDPSTVTVIGELTAMPTVSSNTVMTPVIGILGSRPDLVANPGEVERVFDVALSELAADGVFHEEWWSVPERSEASGIPDGEFPVWFFELAGETVWGATARTLVELVCLVVGVGVPPTLRGEARPR